jgi:hypothetical protein
MPATTEVRRMQESIMFWGVLGLLTLAVAFVKLGALSAWVTILSAALKLLLILAVALAAFVVWRLASK